jgi:hypothetical protein
MLYAVADSIFFDNDRTLFATFKYVGTDFEGDMELMRANPKVREWWAMTDGMQVSRGFLEPSIDMNADTEGLALGQPYTWSCEQCRWPRVVEGFRRGILHRMNHCIDKKMASIMDPAKCLLKEFRFYCLLSKTMSPTPPSIRVSPSRWVVSLIPSNLIPKPCIGNDDEPLASLIALEIRRLR